MSDTLIEAVLATKTLKDLVAPVAGANTSAPELTEETIEAALVLLREVERHGGYGDISATVGHGKITKGQVRHLHDKMRDRIGELQPKPVDG